MAEPSHIAQAVKRSIEIGGDLEQWEGLPQYPVVLSNQDSPTPIKFKGYFSVAWDEHNLYLLGVFDQPEDTASAKLPAHAEEWWNADTVEVFIRTGPNADVLHFAANPKGTRFTSHTASANYRSEGRTGKDHWILELAFPLGTDLLPSVGGDDLWRFKVGRGHPGAQEWSLWPMGGGFLAENNFGRLYFTEQLQDSQALHTQLAAEQRLGISESTCFSGTEAQVDSANIVVGGEPFFPIGFYSKWDYTHEELMYEAATLGAAGFNIMFTETHQPAGTTFENHRELLDEAQRQGIGLFVKYYPGHEAEAAADMTWVNAFKDHPAMLWWVLADDVNNLPAEQVATTDKLVKNADPSHNTYVTGWAVCQGERGIADYMEAADIIAMQSYPIPQECCSWHTSAPTPAPHLSSTFWYMKGTIDRAAPYNRPVVANLQTFSWHFLDTAPNRWPTAKEVDNMSYQAIVAGVKGVLYYTFEDCEENDDPCSTLDVTQPEIWDTTVKVRNELEMLAPALLNGQRTTTVEDEDKSVYSAYWEYEDRVYVIVVNTDDTVKPATVELPTRTVGPAELLFEERPPGMTFSNGALNGEIEPLDVHIYVLNTAATAATPP